MNIGVHVSFLISVFIFFGYIPGSKISGSYSHSIFSFLRNRHTVFHNDCIELTFPQTMQEGLFFSISLPTFAMYRLSDDSHSYRCEVISGF